jgi:cellulase/cellobiase CelA1
MTELRCYEKLWRTALHVTASAFLVAIVGLGMAIPVAHASAVAATLTVEHTWQTGFIANYTITNASMAQLSDWRLEFDLPVGEGLSHTWNSSFAQSGTHFVIVPANWNRTIAPGGSATGGMRGVLTGSYSPPVNCRINGLPCT